MNAKRRRVQVYPSLPPFEPLSRRSNHCTSPSPPHQPHEIAVGGHRIIGGQECEILRSRLRHQLPVEGFTVAPWQQSRLAGLRRRQWKALG